MQKRKQKKTKPIGKIEFIFNIISLLIVIGIGIYFGGRSFYYYNVENFRVVEGNKTLNGSIINNNKVASGEAEGLHQDTDGYYFKGNVSNNYVKFSNRLFRVIGINKDGSVKVISEDIVASFMWGSECNYENSNLKTWLSTDDLGIYYKTLPNPDRFLVKTSYSEDRLNGSKVISNNYIKKDYLTTLTITDYSKANGKDSFLNNNRTFWILGLDDSADNLYVDLDGSVESSLSYEAYGLRVVFTFKKDLNILAGDGSYDNPYIINQGTDFNYVDNYVMLGQDAWKINYDDGNILKMYLAKPIDNTGSSYGKLSMYDYTEFGSLANYLNGNYLKSLTYNNIINDSEFFTGEVSDEFSYDYKNIYTSSVKCKIGMLNMFDYYTGYLDNFFLMNTTSSIGEMIYVYHNTGLLEETTTDDVRLAVPVITINRDLIKSGDGTIDKPFKIE